jgi:DNA-binding beta-propeller fold protein YncE
MDHLGLRRSPLGQSGLGCLGDTVISADGSTLYVTAARGQAGGQAVTRLTQVSVADGQLLGIAYERPFRDPGNIIYGWGPLAIDPSGQHALIAYTGHIGRIDLNTAQLTELPIEENGAHGIAW